MHKTREELFTYTIGAIHLLLAYVWGSAGVEKISSGSFPEELGGTLTHFASQNPFSWYVTFLQSTAIPNAETFGYFVEWGQVAAALALVLGTIALVSRKLSTSHERLVLIVLCAALFGGMFMSAQFYFAAGWTGPGSKTSNVLMFWTQAILFLTWLPVLIAKKR